MTDVEHQNGDSVAFPVSDLMRRLLRRASEPVGVIDTRHAVELHARSSLLPTQRLDFLNNLKTRYGVESGGGGTAISASALGAMPLVSPPERAGAASPFELGSAPPWGSRTAPSETVQASDSGKSPSAQYRVKRPGTQERSGASRPLSVEVATVSRHTGEIQPGMKAVPATLVQRKVEPIQSRGGDTPDSPTPQSLSPGDAPKQAGIFSANSLPQVSERPVTDVTPQMHLRRGPERAAAGGSLPLREDFGGELSPTASGNVPQVSELPRTSVVAPMPLQRMAETGPLAAINFAAASLDDDTSGGQVSTIRKASSHEPPLPGKSGSLPATVSIEAVKAPAALPLAGTESHSRGAVSAEIRVPPRSPGSTSIVWRKADTNLAGQGHAAMQTAMLAGPTYPVEQPVMRKSDSEIGGSGATANLEATSSGNGGVDLKRVAEQVTRIMTRQLRIERERRGKTR